MEVEEDEDEDDVLVVEVVAEEMGSFKFVQQDRWVADSEEDDDDEEEVDDELVWSSIPSG